jgi:hypothetical protein
MLRGRYALLRETRNPGRLPNPRESLYKKRPTLTGVQEVGSSNIPGPTKLKFGRTRWVIHTSNRE